jgi:hypothetical protein
MTVRPSPFTLGIASRWASTSSAIASYGQAYNPLATLKALTYFEDGALRRLPRAVRDRLVRACRAVDLDRLPEVLAQ